MTAVTLLLVPTELPSQLSLCMKRKASEAHRAVRDAAVNGTIPEPSSRAPSLELSAVSESQDSHVSHTLPDCSWLPRFCSSRE